jgi:cellulose synthase/poly-beta-1,6-N-acetylglucosamine synthase-like glycosyltransferase
MDTLPKFSLIIPCFNAKHLVQKKIKNSLSLTLPNKEIILVNDGSTDGTIEFLKSEYQLLEIPRFFVREIMTKEIYAIYKSMLHPELIVIDKEHGHKYDTCNVGINASSGDYLIVTDVDTLIDNKGVNQILRPIFSTDNVKSVGVSIRILNGCTVEKGRVHLKKFPSALLPAFQANEYLRSFFIRNGIDLFNTAFCIAGAFSIFPRKTIIDVGGFVNTVADDLEITMRLQKLFRKKKIPFKIFYLPDPVAWTDAPTTLKALERQRANWHRGLLESFWFHKKIAFNPQYGAAGLIGYPFIFLSEVIEPFIELLGYLSILASWYIGILKPIYLLLFLGFSMGFTFFLSISCLFIEELSFNKFPKFRGMLLLVLSSFIENFGYRQLTIFWRVKGIYQFFKNFKKINYTAKKIREIEKNCPLNQN